MDRLSDGIDSTDQMNERGYPINRGRPDRYNFFIYLYDPPMHCSRHNNMSLLWITGLCVTALVVVRISNWWYRWSSPKSNGKLPPGSMGFPIIGETFDFFKPHGFYEISPFLKKKMLRSGFIHLYICI